MKVLMYDSNNTYAIDGGLLVKSGTGVGTGSQQTIMHGFGTTWTHLKIKLISDNHDIINFNYEFDDVNGRDHFHVTVSNDLEYTWIAEVW